MSEYLLSIVGIVFLAAIVNAILPEGKTSGMVKSVLKLLCILVILTPFAKIVQQDGVGVENYFAQSVIKIDESFIEYCSEKAISATQTKIEEEIFQEFGQQVSVKLEWRYSQAEEQGGRIEIVCIYVRSSKENQAEIQEYICKKYGCKVEMQAWT